VRIVFLSPSGELGGAETALVDMLAAIRDARPDWTLALIAASDGPLLAKAAAHAGVVALPFPPALARLGEWGTRGSAGTRLRLGLGLIQASAPALRYARRLQRRLFEFQPDIIHSNGLKMHLLGARARPPHARLVWHLHDYPGARRLTARLLASQARRCDAMLANSESVAVQTRDMFGPAVPVHTIYNSIDLDRFSPVGPHADLDGLAGLRPLAAGGIRVGLVATFARWKGHAVFLEALARLRGKIHVRGYIVGDSIYHTDSSQYSQAELRAQAQALGLGDSVGFTGKVDDVSSVLRALDIAVHASTEPEPFGLVIAEAMACGRPIVVSRAGGAAEIAEGGALFHEPGNSTELAERLLQLANDAARRETLGSEGREAALRLFSRTRLRKALIPFYEELMPPKLRNTSGQVMVK
jgi:glycosyltransferase involved in cell wall biosynthesis